MTREEFFNSIKNVTEQDILPAFDSLMAFFNIYNAIGLYNNVEITRTDDELANFDIIFKDGIDINEMNSKFGGGLNIYIYGIQWHIKSEVKDSDCLHISLTL